MKSKQVCSIGLNFIAVGDRLRSFILSQISNHAGWGERIDRDGLAFAIGCGNWLMGGKGRWIPNIQAIENVAFAVICSGLVGKIVITPLLLIGLSALRESLDKLMGNGISRNIKYYVLYGSVCGIWLGYLQVRGSLENKTVLYPACLGEIPVSILGNITSKQS